MPLNAFADSVIWPKCIALRGASIGPEFRTEEVTTASGAAWLSSRWQYEQNRYEIGMTARPASEYAALSAIFRVCRGRAIGFRLEDPLDHEATGDEAGVQSTADPDVWQVVKVYESGLESYTRKIVKLQTDTVTFSSTGTYTVDHDTGLITRTSGADPVLSAFRFHVPVWFVQDRIDAEIIDRQPGADGEVLVQLGRLTLRERLVP